MAEFYIRDEKIIMYDGQCHIAVATINPSLKANDRIVFEQSFSNKDFKTSKEILDDLKSDLETASSCISDAESDLSQLRNR